LAAAPAIGGSDLVSSVKQTSKLADKKIKIVRVEGSFAQRVEAIHRMEELGPTAVAPKPNLDDFRAMADPQRARSSVASDRDQPPGPKKFKQFRQELFTGASLALIVSSIRRISCISAELEAKKIVRIIANSTSLTAFSSTFSQADNIIARHAYNALAYLYELPESNLPAKQNSRWDRLSDRERSSKQGRN
jgi:hypothetical protein